MSGLVWLITGCTSGSGLALVHAIVSRGDKVIATGRGATTRLASLQSSSPHSITALDLDVTSPLLQIQSIIDHAVSIHGRIDVLVNNAGRTGMSTLEEGSEDFVKNIFDINLFGATKVTQAVLPHMRAAKQGTVAFIGAGLGWVALPFLTHYSVTKAALTSSPKRDSTLGLRSIIFEPGGFDSDLTTPTAGSPNTGGPTQLGDYGPLFNRVFGPESGIPSGAIAPSDITKLTNAIIDVIKGEGLAKGRPFPVRVVLGPDSLEAIRQKCNEQLKLMHDWEDVSLSVSKEGSSGASRWLLDNASILNKS
ncbi:hypothetical protein QBC37DRAFT_385409 [Rhypophila decipiens]|uniref:NAD(P)-binding protein n=1 Tax=Rhypophila decipiens TaxID=261697 RepID=A0AAN7BAG7_9PEZI|nr:hypothetical protein QBC37DRAFT_385409 [Rhypophila decipiens]